VLEEVFGLAGWIEEPLETRWIQEIHGTWGLRRHNRAHPKRSCERQLEKDEPRAEIAKDATGRRDTVERCLACEADRSETWFQVLGSKF
jgi:hypothetical protein